MKLEKEAICKFLKKLNKELLFRFSEMKIEFERSPPLNNEIKKRFLVFGFSLRTGNRNSTSW